MGLPPGPWKLTDERPTTVVDNNGFMVFQVLPSGIETAHTIVRVMNEWLLSVEEDKGSEDDRK